MEVVSGKREEEMDLLALKIYRRKLVPNSFDTWSLSKKPLS